MAKIIAPNKQYIGVSASVGFVNGVGETDNPTLLKWFKDHGYEVKETEDNVQEEQSKVKELKDMTVEELTEYAKKNEIDLGKATTQNGILDKIQEALKDE